MASNYFERYAKSTDFFFKFACAIDENIGFHQWPQIFDAFLCSNQKTLDFWLHFACAVGWPRIL